MQLSLKSAKRKNITNGKRIFYTDIYTVLCIYLCTAVTFIGTLCFFMWIQISVFSFKSEGVLLVFLWDNEFSVCV